MRMIIKRNLMLFFRDRANVFFSMLAVIIAILLYILFLADLMTGAIDAYNLGATPSDIRLVISGMILSGTIAIATVTTCLNGAARLVIDREETAKDFFVSPIPRTKLMFGYVLSSGIIGLTMSGVALATTLVYLSISSGSLPTIGDMALLLATLLLSVISANSMVFLLASLLKSRNAFASLGSLVGTLIGFLTGVYIPVGQLPNSVSWIVRLFPTSHAASMFRQILASNTLSEIGAPVEIVNEVNYFFGAYFTIGNLETNFVFSAAFLAATSVAFYAVSLSLMKKRTF